MHKLYCLWCQGPNMQSISSQFVLTISDCFYTLPPYFVGVSHLALGLVLPLN